MKKNIKQEPFSFTYILTVADNRNRTSRTQRQSLSFAKRKEIIAYLNAIMSALQEWLQTANVERSFDYMFLP